MNESPRIRFIFIPSIRSCWSREFEGRREEPLEEVDVLVAIPGWFEISLECAGTMGAAGDVDLKVIRRRTEASSALAET